MIELKDVSFGYGREPVLQNVSCRMENHQITGIIGSNGAGKSTLLRLCARMMKPQSGQIAVDDRPSTGYSAKAFARQLSFLPQQRSVPSVTVQNLVMMGRYAHDGGHEQAVESALRAVGLTELADRDVRSLSGGQRQMAYLAMLLAQESPNVLLDEPLTHLDIGAQLDAARVIRGMKDRCVVVVMHDLTMLDRVCDRVLLLDKGRITFDGSPQACLHSPQLQQAFGVRSVKKQIITFERS